MIVITITIALFLGMFVGSVATMFAILSPERGPIAPPPGSKGTK